MSVFKRLSSRLRLAPKPTPRIGKSERTHMETLLNMLKEEIFAATGSWFTDVGDPIVLFNESLAGLVDVCYRPGPFVRATDDAAAIDK